MTFYETKKRTLVKAVLWRFIAFINSWVVLQFLCFNSSFYSALAMNITGMVLFYVYERVCNFIKKGKYIA